MAQRVHIDCREFPSEMNCTLAMAADSEKKPRRPKVVPLVMNSP